MKHAYRIGVDCPERRSREGGPDRLASPEGSSLSPALALAERWAAEKGDETTRVSGVFADDRVEELLRLHHGPAPIDVRDLGSCVAVLGFLDFPKSVRETLAGEPAGVRASRFLALREALMSSPRVGFS